VTEHESLRLGYQLPPSARSASERASQLVAGAVDHELLEEGALLYYPTGSGWSARIEQFAQEFGRRHPLWVLELCEHSDRRLALRIRGPGVESWLRAALARAHPSLRTQLRQRTRLRERCRNLTRHLRGLPDFFIIGAPRCGTTTLFNALVRHPSVVPPARKEVAFFNVQYDRGLPWYRSNFPGSWRRFGTRVRTGAFATGDATPTYLFHPHVAHRIRSVLPDARFIVLLRDPVERAYSHYHWALKMGYELLSFEAAVDREQERVDGELDHMLSDESYLSFPRSYLSYLGMGIYVDQLLMWRQVFPEEQFLVLSTDDLKRRPEDVVRRTLRFLGLPQIVLGLPERNVGSYPPMGEGTRARLKAYFRPHDRRLGELLGAAPGWVSTD
jgi:hypothetical protein